jgi:hypothetical protein
VNEVKVLGMSITREPANWNSNFTSIYDTLLTEIEFWKRLIYTSRPNLCNKDSPAFPINNLGCFLFPLRRDIKLFQTATDNFAKGKLNFAAARINVPPAAGGMVLFNVEEFLIAQQCCWVFSCIQILQGQLVK